MRNKASKTTPVSALSSIKRTFPDASPVSLPSPSPVTFLITTACCCCSSSAVPGGEASSGRSVLQCPFSLSHLPAVDGGARPARGGR